jgi:hypothetical protein
MRKTRVKKDKIKPINEGVYDFYEAYDPEGASTPDKIINYYIDKIRKYGLDSLTQKEKEVFENAKKGKLTLEKPVYKRNKVTGDIELDNLGNPVRLDKEDVIPGIPFITSKGKGGKKKEVINGRIYWDIDEDYRIYFVYGGESSDVNPHGLIEWKTISKDADKEFGAFMKPKAEINMQPFEWWKYCDNKYDKGVVLDKEIYLKFLEFDKLYHESRKKNRDRISVLYKELKNYKLK